MQLSLHTAQAFANASCETRCLRYERRQLHDTPPRPLPVSRGGRTSKRCRRRHLLASSNGWSNFLVPQDLREVCPLSRGVILQPLSAPLQDGVRLLPHPLPASASVGLAASLPRRDADGFITFRRCTVRRLGRASPPGERRPRAVSSEYRSLSPCLLAQACQPLWPVITNGVYQRFTCVDLTSRSWFPTALRLAVAASAHALAALPKEEVTLSRKLRTSSLPTTRVPVGYCRRNRR